MRRRTLLAVGVLVTLVVVGLGAFTVLSSGGDGYSLEYKLVTDCEGDRAVEANETRDSGATLLVRNMSENTAYAEVRAVDGTFGETTVATVDSADDTAIVQNLSYYDTVIVTVQPENDHREVLERHEFTCADVVNSDACADGNESDSE